MAVYTLGIMWFVIKANSSLVQKKQRRRGDLNWAFTSLLENTKSEKLTSVLSLIIFVKVTEVTLKFLILLYFVCSSYSNSKTGRRANTEKSNKKGKYKKDQRANPKKWKRLSLNVDRSSAAVAGFYQRWKRWGIASLQDEEVCRYS